jgi:hypothetical protein
MAAKAEEPALGSAHVAGRRRRSTPANAGRELRFYLVDKCRRIGPNGPIDVIVNTTALTALDAPRICWRGWSGSRGRAVVHPSTASSR